MNFVMPVIKSMQKKSPNPLLALENKTALCLVMGFLMACSLNNALYASSPMDYLAGNMDARSLALGGAVTGNSGALTSFSKNPSVLAVSSGTFLGTTIGTRPLGSKMVQATYCSNIKGQNIGLHVFDALYPSESKTDLSGRVQGEFNNSDMTITGAAGKEINGVRFGAATTIVRKKLADKLGYGCSLTGAIQVPVSRRFTVGLSANDVTLSGLSIAGETEKFSTQYRAGASLRLMDRDNLSLEVMNDIASSAFSDLNYHFGAELTLNEIFFIRGGLSSESAGGRLGLGVILNQMKLDWSMQMSPLGSKDFMHLTLSYRFK